MYYQLGRFPHLRISARTCLVTLSCHQRHWIYLIWTTWDCSLRLIMQNGKDIANKLFINYTSYLSERNILVQAASALLSLAFKILPSLSFAFPCMGLTLNYLNFLIIRGNLELKSLLFMQIFVDQMRMDVQVLPFWVGRWFSSAPWLPAKRTCQHLLPFWSESTAK